MTLSRASMFGVLLIVMTSACVSVERIPDHFCTGWDDGLDAANEVRASVGLDPIALDCDRDSGLLSEIEVITQKGELGRLTARELYCWGGTNGYTATLRDAQDMLDLTDQDIQDALVQFYRECVEKVDAEIGE
ncbi:MAG TPA: hypothetical protein VM848_06025 [Acidimicrobiia bacterium]|nr:hypothetical protein [Acidimicrobiia bacterium]